MNIYKAEKCTTGNYGKYKIQAFLMVRVQIKYVKKQGTMASGSKI